jgi:hypothetical protein
VDEEERHVDGEQDRHEDEQLAHRCGKVVRGAEWGKAARRS